MSRSLQGIRIALLALLLAPALVWAQSSSTLQGMLDHIDVQNKAIVINDQLYHFDAALNTRSSAGLSLAPNQLRPGMLLEFVVQHQGAGRYGRVVQIQVVKQLRKMGEE